MHELSIAHAVVRTVTDAVPGRTVLGVRLGIGVLSGVAPEALRFAWGVATAGTPLAGSALQVDRIPLTGRCLDCDAVAEHDRPPPLACAACGGRVLPVDGEAARALEVVSVEVDDDPPGPPGSGDGAAVPAGSGTRGAAGGSGDGNGSGSGKGGTG